MPRFLRIAAAASCALLLVAASRGLAAPAAPNANAASSIRLLSPLSVTKNRDLDFGTLIVAGAGTAVIDPVAGTLTTTGALSAVGASAHPATFTGVGSKTSVVHIRLPRTPVVLTRVGGTETMSVANWTLDGDRNRKVPTGMAFDFAIGATLTAAAGQMDGTYAGSFEITVQYP